MIHINSLAFYTSTLSKLKGYRHRPGLFDAYNGKSPSRQKGAEIEQASAYISCPGSTSFSL